MRAALANLSRYLATPRVSKYRIFIWAPLVVLPDDGIYVFARDDDYFLGVLHSRLHEVWARAQGTQVRERESGFRYTPTTCFETFPFRQPTPEQEAAIAEAAKELDRLRNNWLNPREWTREEILEFPGSVDGPWSRYVQDADEHGIGTVRYPRIVPKDAILAKNLVKRTLTNLYNERPTWLDMAHRKLDEAVFAAYGWEPTLSDEEILEKLLALNLEASAQQL
jgi:type II restriction/modification system DNA methylase subunit YeeA